MVFHADTAFAVELLALVAAAALLLAAKKSEGAAKGLVLVIAYFSIVAAILALLCTSYYALRYREDGWFKTPFPTPHGMMGGPGMMGGGGFMGRSGMMGGGEGNCPMMEEKMKMMQEKMEQMKPEGDHHGETKSPGSNDEKSP
jgi:hypothetical protein